MMEKKAFTLIEILIVVLILGILVNIAVPVIKGAINKARLAEMKIVLRTLSNAIERYYFEHGKWPGYLDPVDPFEGIPNDLLVDVSPSEYFYYNVHYHADPASAGGQAKAYYKPYEANGETIFGCYMFECCFYSDGTRTYDWKRPGEPWQWSTEGWPF